MSLLAEIKRRKVAQVAVAYAIVAWLLVQVVVAIKAPLNLPSWFDTATIVLLAICFPVALILSWAFDLTPQGIVRDRDGRSDSPGSEHATSFESSQAPGGSAKEKREEKGTQSLRELIAAGPMSTSRLLSLAVRIAEALAGAHANEIVHGALRPATVMITADDQVRLVGFGLGDTASSSEGAEASAYMAPERARGEVADYRSDQFSFGAVLYEMATGHPAFSGSTEIDTLAAVIHVDPEPVSRFNPEVPMPLQWAIERCLAKNPRDRYPSMHSLCTDIASVAETVKTATSARFAPAHNLPAQRTPLIGREQELREIKELVLGGARLLTLTGAGGIGKTRLLIEAGRALLENFRGGVFLTPLDRVADAELVSSEIANSLSVQQVSDRPAAAVLQNHLRQYCVEPTLLLIDNFEHVLKAAPMLTDLLAASEQLQIVVTSRAALRVYGEQEFRVASLAVSDHGASTTRLAESPAVKLFLERATSLREHHDDEELRTVAQICERLDGLPLAIELAAARTKVLSLPDLLERISDPLRLLSGGARDLPARQRTLRATLEWSYNLLDEDQQKLFRRLGVFVGGATLEAIEAVCNVDEDLHVDLIEAVESLVDSSLLRPMEVEHSERRFTMFDTMREYVLGKLAEAGEDVRARRAHAAYCVVLAEESSYLPTAAQREALYDRFERELGNIRAALDWLTASRDVKWGLRLANSLGHYWIQRGRRAEGYERLMRLLALEEASSESGLRVWALCWAGDLAVGAHPEEENRYHMEGLALARELGITPAVLRGLNALAVQSQQHGEFDLAEAYHEEAIQIARDAGGSVAILGGMLSNYADLAMARGDYDLAQRLHEETSQLFLKEGDHIALAWSLNHQADVARARRDFDAARRLYEESLEKFRGLQERTGIAVSLYDLAALAADVGDCGEAEKLNGEALALYRDLGHRGDLPRVLEALARCALETGDARRGLTLAGSAAAMRATLSIPAREADQVELNRRLDVARQQMSGSAATATWMAGWGMEPEQAIDFALHRPDAPSRAED